jgi:hypothetical protein
MPLVFFLFCLTFNVVVVFNESSIIITAARLTDHFCRLATFKEKNVIFLHRTSFFSKENRASRNSCRELPKNVVLSSQFIK